MRAHNFLRIILLATVLTVCNFYVFSAHRNAIVTSQKSLAVPDDIALLSRSEAEAMWHDPTTLFLDVRSLEDYNNGHIEGSWPLPIEEITDRLSAMREKLERANQLIVYCKSTDCGKSLWAAIRLRNAGLKRIAIYPGGWNEWVLAGLPTAGTGR